MTLAMIVSAFGSLHVNFLGGPRVPYAMARDGVFFSFAKRVQPRFHTPSGAVIFQGCVAILLVLTGTYQEVYSLGMFAISAFFATDGPGPDSTTPYGTGANPPLSSLGIPLDRVRFRRSGFRDLREFVAGTSYSVVHRPGNYPAWRPVLSSLARARQEFYR